MLPTQDRSAKPSARGGSGAEGSESLSNKVRDLEAKLRGNRPTDKKPKDLIRAIGNEKAKDNFDQWSFHGVFPLLEFSGKLDRNDWQLSALEKKIEENATPGLLKEQHDNKVPKWNKDAFTDKALPLFFYFKKVLKKWFRHGLLTIGIFILRTV